MAGYCPSIELDISVTGCVRCGLGWKREAYDWNGKLDTICNAFMLRCEYPDLQMYTARCDHPFIITIVEDMEGMVECDKVVIKGLNNTDPLDFFVTPRVNGNRVWDLIAKQFPKSSISPYNAMKGCFTLDVAYPQFVMRMHTNAGIEKASDEFNERLKANLPPKPKPIVRDPTEEPKIDKMMLDQYNSMTTETDPFIQFMTNERLQLAWNERRSEMMTLTHRMQFGMTDDEMDETHRRLKDLSAISWMIIRLLRKREQTGRADV